MLDTATAKGFGSRRSSAFRFTSRGIRHITSQPYLPVSCKLPTITMAPRLTAAEVLAHPAYETTIWDLKPTQSGILPVAADRGGPIKVSWEVHGHGDIKLVWVMGLGAIKSAWQRQTMIFGHEQGDKYSALVLDNRGMGESDKPLMRYSTSEMAKDIIEICDHIGWTEPRQLHVIGVSMGGMISQEIAWAIPERIASLSLVSTAARIENTTTYVENLRTRINMFIPKSLDDSVTHAARNMFSDEWLEAPDDGPIPTETTPGVNLPPGGIRRFPSNFERFAAQELHKRLSSEAFQRKGFVMQAIAAGWHHKSPAQLKELGDKVGRDRILVMHGDNDNMITVPHGRKLIAELEPAESYIRPGKGHVLMLEEWKWHNETIAKLVVKTEAMKA